MRPRCVELARVLGASATFSTYKRPLAM
jgi:hypothetical protein